MVAPRRRWPLLSLEDRAPPLAEGSGAFVEIGRLAGSLLGEAFGGDRLLEALFGGGAQALADGRVGAGRARGEAGKERERFRLQCLVLDNFPGNPPGRRLL